MIEIKNSIMKFKPNLKLITLELYLRNLKIIFQEINETDSSPINIKFLSNFNNVMHYLNTRNINTKKTYMTAIVVALHY